jgi:uncharacterized membrane protein YhaH (DUF805 family)
VLTEKYADFSGRARRAEFWWSGVISAVAYFVILVGGLILGLISDLLGTLSLFVVFGYGLAVLVSGMAVAVRRLHDTNKTGWLLLIGLILFAGIVLLVCYFIDGDRHDNQYEPSPKYVA